ncbi:MAG: Eco57I restriction-modification methylase domain-containing protein [Acidobacteriia bacterium]|nr:Eco57I restriction-modification methylase domain-containing protein [Terriglobia bacterium]
MSLNLSTVRQYLRGFEFKKLFIEELGWDHYKARLDIPVEGQPFILNAVAQKRGFQVFVCESETSAHIPDHATRGKIETQATKSAHEHIVIYIDAAKTTQVWQWVKREPGKPTARREHTYHRDQPGDGLIQKLQNLFFPLEEEFALSLVDVTRHARAAFDVERVTKRFYDRFKSEHAAFLKFLKGIPDEDLQRWYVSVMLNRLMFIYFIQKKSFLDDDQNYLMTRLAESRDRRKDRFYRDFLCPLFFEGFAKKPHERSQSVNRLLGKVPYLNGGLFLRHQIEEAHGKDIQIGDGAFEKLFSFFEQYQWHLDERPLRADNEINPDVLGYIFEKYINQKQMGAYYTKEDITGYISQNTVIPFLFDAAQKKCKIAFDGEQSIWRLLQADPDRYIYPAVRRGVVDPNGDALPENALPDFVQKGMCDPQARMFDKRYNLGEAVICDAEGNNLALPTETWREYIERRKGCLELRTKLAAGEIRSINDLITYNLDIRQFAQDVIENSEGPELLRAFYHAIEQVTVLDSACGSGAFLFAALNILEPLYEACLDRMESFLEDLERSGENHRPEKFGDFRKILDRVEQHPNRRYFILKSIILNNLYGVDIMEEATEICKLRLFLKLVAQIDSVEKIEPLPDIDFNIRAGNSLVGYATYEDVKRAVGSKLDFAGAMQSIEEKAQDVDRLFGLFRQQQTAVGGEVTAEDKAELRKRLKVLEEELNGYLAGEHGVKAGDREGYRKWVGSHKPFHWFIEFYGIMKRGGFDAVIANPPYVEKRVIEGDYTLLGYESESTNNLFAYFIERAAQLQHPSALFGFIVPLSSMATDKFAPLQRIVLRHQNVWLSNFDDRPSRLFEGLEHIQLTIILYRKSGRNGAARTIFTTRCAKWSATERVTLFETLSYAHPEREYLTNSVPKVGSQLEVGILDKLWKKGGPLGVDISESGKQTVFYTRKIHAFLNVLDFVPEIRDGRGRKREPSEQKTLSFNTVELADVAFCALNSTLFRWFITAFSDCRNLNRREVLSFPVNLSSLATANGGSLTRLARTLSNRLMGTSEFRQMSFAGETLRVQCIIPKFSKPIINEVDVLLGNHYGFSNDELDFIVNYDIKYRVGREGAEEDSQE